jgi:hypothetical protein
MAMGLVTASSQRLLLAAPATTALPWTIGAWFNPRGSGTRDIWSSGESGSLVNYRLPVVVGGDVQFAYNDGTTTSTITLNAVATAGAWHYVVARGISLSNRRASIIATSTGTITHGSSTATRLSSTINQMALGFRANSTPTAYYEGAIAEFFYADVDVQADGLQLDEALLHQLAYRGPFSVPHLAAAIVEYRSLRGVAFDSANDASGEVYQRGARRDWVAAGGPTPADHPPLYSGYVRPNQKKRFLTI